MLTTDRVSVVIPVKNERAALERVLADLAAQSSPPDEVIIVDNNSDDDLFDLAEDERVRVVVEREPGIPAAASRGYDLARYEIIARCDADSRLPPHWIAAVRGALADASVEAVSGPGRFYGAPAWARRWQLPLSRLYMGAYRFTMVLALGHPPLFGSNFAMRADAWRSVRDTVHRTGTDIHDDVDLSVHLGLDHRIVWLPSLRVGISSAPLERDDSSAERLARGWRSIVMHWPDELPPVRHVRRAAARPARSSD